jgi:peptidoglycan/xylan/chitin deacetylase (PgdA/CDA1 family)
MMTNPSPGVATPRSRPSFPRSPVALAVAVLSVLVGSSLLFSNYLGAAPAPLALTVRGRPAFVSPGTTFGQAVHRYRLVPKAGDLRGVGGSVLAPGVFHGRVLLNGGLALSSRPLATGDVLTVVDGRTKVERLEQVTDPAPQPVPPDPQYFLGAAPGRVVVTRGRTSHHVVSTRFEATGPVEVPGAVALTFDDGPWPHQTERILAILRAFHVRATFFDIGYLVERYPGIVRHEIQSGMTVGNHSYDHPNSPPFREFSATRTRGEMAGGNRALRGAGVSHPALFRPPGGTWSATELAVARSLGLRVVLWNVDPRDWAKGATAHQIAANVLATVRAGSIVDLHDGGGQSPTAKALPAIIRGIRAMGLQIVPILP